MHEFGHTFGDLADEYESPNPALTPCNSNIFEPSEFNVTSSAITLPPLARIKWNDPSPGKGISPWLSQFNFSLQQNTDTTPNQPGLYEGAYYCNQNFYRPTFNSMMRTKTQRFDMVNEELLARRIHDYVSPIDSFSPTGASIDISQGTLQNFSIQTLSGIDGTSVIEWRLDGSPIGYQSTQTLDASFLPFGMYTLEVIVTESNHRVRRDLLNQMTATHKWEISVVP